MIDCSLANRVSAMVVLGALLGATNAQASIVTYPNFASWSSAVSGTTSVTIPDPAPDPFAFIGSGSASVTYGGVTFSTNSVLSDGNFYNVGSGFSGSAAVLSSQQQSFGVPNILVTLPSPVTAFSLNYGYGTFNGSAVTFLLSNGDTVTQGSTGSGYVVPDFFGVTDNNPFTSILVTSPDSILNLNNVVYGNATATPLPASSTMMLIGLVGLGFAATRRAKKHASAAA
jgi:hypothetical protein